MVLVGALRYVVAASVVEVGAYAALTLDWEFACRAVGLVRGIVVAVSSVFISSDSSLSSFCLF